MADIDNNKLIGLLVISWGGLLLTQEHIYKKKRKRIQWVRPWIRKRDSKGAYYSVINDLRLTDKENFWKKNQRKTIGNHSYTFILFKEKSKLCVSTFFYTVQIDNVYQKVLYNSCFFLFLRHEIQKTKEHILHKWGSLCFTQKNNFCIMNKTKLIWFYSLYKNYFFE